ncbi:phospholipase/carboxylesterase [Paucibacter oligotrophus]|uniref:Phospholipase/carboxylesterase n=1 Tax=Roseateles oligotrophus TaxID=1769250 RepID=A0A840L9I8_9BURK|nr:esterase [Roseateles oligotrophus]MBB4842789.1 phospholipase/carboxylesterase [Roseateles oligotrophus]
MNPVETQDSNTPPALVHLPASGAVDLCFVLLHGLGADAASMEPLRAALRAQYPQAALVSLNAPLALAEGGRAWFAVDGLDEAVLAQRLDAALPALIQRVQGWARHFGLDWGRIALAGFSQGATLALEAVQAQDQLAGRVLAFSGGHGRVPERAPHEVSLHLLHGLDDGLVPYRPVVNMARTLVALGADVTADVLPGIGHELHPKLVDKAMEQLRTFVPARLWRAAQEAAAEQDRQAKH